MAGIGSLWPKNLCKFTDFSGFGDFFAENLKQPLVSFCGNSYSEEVQTVDANEGGPVGHQAKNCDPKISPSVQQGHTKQ